MPRIETDDLETNVDRRVEDWLNDTHIYEVSKGQELTPLGEGIAWLLGERWPGVRKLEDIYEDWRTVRERLEALENPHRDNRLAADQAASQWRASQRSKLVLVDAVLKRLEERIEAEASA